LTFGVNINCLTKSVTFSKPVEEVSGMFLIAEQVKKSLYGEASWFGTMNKSYFDCAISDVCIRVGRIEEAVGRIA